MVHTRTAVKALALALAATSVASLVFLYGNDPELLARQGTTFVDPSGDVLVGSYYPGSVPRGAILLHGFSGEQAAMKGIASEMASMGLHVLTFDFSGHGLSPGTITLDNARLDRLARQVIAAKEQFGAITGLNQSEIVLVGHSMGARVAIEAEVIDSEPVAGIVALGASINLLPNVQSEFFTGTSDADIPWIQGLNATNPGVGILLITGEWDDVLPPAAADALAAKLREGSYPGSPERRLEVVAATVHNYEIYSPAVVALAKPWIAARLGLATGTDTTPHRTISRSAWWALFAVALFGVVFAATWLVKGKGLANQTHDGAIDNGLELRNFKRFVAAKFLLWIPGALVGFGATLLLLALPLGLPVFNLIYVAFIGGHGILLSVLYRRGKMPGTAGRLVTGIKREFEAMTSRDWARAALTIGAVTTACLLACNTGLASAAPVVYPFSDRTAWLAVFTGLTALGFLIAPFEAEMLAREARPRSLAGLVLGIAGLFPFMLVAAFFGAIGSTSGMVGALQGLVSIGLVLACGPLVNTASRNKLIAAIFQAFLLQLIVGSQGALFALTG
ncbi:MAG: alpha/beta fold hydrolase [Candidatus Lokiarchaeota archaeon]|nr:alpha/beta fold hydrolase [Candidatus Lokiarchaeota archaeon]